MIQQRYVASPGYFFAPGCLDTALGQLFDYGSLTAYTVSDDGLAIDAIFDETALVHDLLTPGPEPAPWVVPLRPFVPVPEEELPI